MAVEKMQHDLLEHLPLYEECLYCSYIDQDLSGKKCAVCGIQSRETRLWFPEEAYEYVVLLEDYHLKEPSSILQEYLRDNEWDFWTSGNPQKKPIADWKPMTILLFRSLFELLLEHCLWKLIRVHLFLSPYATDYANFILKQFSSVTSKKDKCYKFVTGNKWKDDMKRLGYQDLDRLLDQAAVMRNDFIHADPTAGSSVVELANSLRDKVPDLFELFAKIANEYHHPHASDLSKIEIRKIEEDHNPVSQIKSAPQQVDEADD
jgi:hypothetical protein